VITRVVALQGVLAFGDSGCPKCIHVPKSTYVGQDCPYRKGRRMLHVGDTACWRSMAEGSLCRQAMKPGGPLLDLSGHDPKAVIAARCSISQIGEGAMTLWFVCPLHPSKHAKSSLFSASLARPPLASPLLPLLLPLTPPFFF
jgi:hypothetical protein